MASVRLFRSSVDVAVAVGAAAAVVVGAATGAVVRISDVSSEMGGRRKTGVKKAIILADDEPKWLGEKN